MLYPVPLGVKAIIFFFEANWHSQCEKEQILRTVTGMPNMERDMVQFEHASLIIPFRVLPKIAHFLPNFSTYWTNKMALAPYL